MFGATRIGDTNENVKSASPKLRGLIKVSAGTEYEDCLTSWSSEDKILHNYFGADATAYFLKIQQVFAVYNGSSYDASYVMLPPTDGDGGDNASTSSFEFKHSLSKPRSDWSSVLFNEIYDGVDREFPTGTQACQIVESCNNIFAVYVVEPVVEWILEHKWDTVMCLKSWSSTMSQSTLQWPPVSMVPMRQIAGDGVEDDDVVQPLGELLETTIETLRFTSRLALSELGEEERVPVAKNVKSIVRQLEKWCHTVGSEIRGPGGMVKGKGGFMISPIRMFQLALISLASSQQKTSIRDLIKDCLDFVWPGSAASIRNLAGSNYTANLAIFLLDVAHMLFFQEEIAAANYNFMYFWRMDSSPQGGFDWLLSSYIMVHRALAGQIYNAIQKLARNAAEAIPLRELVELTRLLYDSIITHSQVPMQLAKGRSGLVHKIACLLHALFLDTRSAAEMHTVFDNSVSTTTDMGTEFGATEFRLGEYTHLLPSWLQLLDELADEGITVDDGGLVESDIEADGPALDEQNGPCRSKRLGDHLYENACRLGGVCHIINNALFDSKEKFTWFATFEIMLRQLIQLFSRKADRDMFVATCAVGPYTFLEQMLSNLMPRYITWRWLSMKAVLDPLLKVGSVCRNAWKHGKARYMTLHAQKKQQEQPNDDGAAPIDNKTVNDAFMSARFWCYCEMLAQHFQVPASMMAWFEDCPCHRGKLRDAHVVHDRRPTYTKLLCSREVVAPAGTLEEYERAGCCPCGSMVLPEAVHDEHIDAFKSITAQASGEFLANSMRWDPQQEDVDFCLQEFHNGQEMVSEILQLKLLPIKQFPLVMAGMAHHDECKGKEFAKTLMQAYDLEPNPELHHRRAVHVFARNGKLRGQLEAWVYNAVPVPLEELPELLQVFAELRLIPMSERHVEAEHSKLKRKIIFKSARHALCSAHLRTQSLRRRLRKEPHKAKRFVALVSNARSCLFIEERFGMPPSGPPNSSTSKRRSQLKSWIYRADLRTRHNKRSAEQAFHVSKTKATEKVQEKAAKVPRVRQSMEGMMAREWMNHMRQVVSPNDVLQFPADVAIQLEDTVEHLSTPATQARSVQENDDGTLEADVDHTIDREGDAEIAGLFVRVVLWHPSKLKGARPLAGDGRPLTNSDVCISIHRRIANDSDGSGVISCSRDTATVSTRFLTTGLQKNFRLLDQAGFHSWSKPEPLQYWFTGVAMSSDKFATLRHTCTMLMKSRAFSEDDPCYVPMHHDDTNDVLRVCLAQNCVGHRAPDGWWMTKVGFQRLQYGCNYKDALCLTRPRPLAIELPSQTTFELLHALEDGEWTWKPLPAIKDRPTEFGYSSGSAKLWYGGVDRHYMLCLLHADANPTELQDLGYSMVKHNQTSKQYKKLFEN